MPFVVVPMLVLCYRALVGMHIAAVLERKEEKWDTIAELQHMTSLHIQCVLLFLRWRRGRSDNSGYRKRFVSVTVAVRHAALSYRLSPYWVDSQQHKRHWSSFVPTALLVESLLLSFAQSYFSSWWLCIVQVAMIYSGQRFCFQERQQRHFLIAN